MPIPFSTIAEVFQMSIAKKQDFHAFIKFQRSSRDSYVIAQKVKTKFSIPVEEIFVSGRTQPYTFVELHNGHKKCRRVYAKAIQAGLPVRVVVNTVNMSKAFPSHEEIHYLLHFAKETNLTANLMLLKDIKGTPDQFNSILETLDIRRITIRSHIFRRDHLNVSAIGRIDRLSICGDQHHILDIHEAEFLALKMPRMHLYRTEITAWGLNKFLKQWLAGERQIVYLKLTSQQIMDAEEISDGIDVDYTDGTATLTRGDNAKIRVSIFGRKFTKVEIREA